MHIFGFGKDLRISNFSAVKRVILHFLRNHPYASLKECLYDFYGSLLFNALPKGLRNSVLVEYFEDEYCKVVCDFYLDKPLSQEELESILISKGFVGDSFPIYSYYTRNYKQNDDNDVYLYYYELDRRLDEEKLALKYLNRLRESYEQKNDLYDKKNDLHDKKNDLYDKSTISFVESLELLEKVEREFMLNSSIRLLDIYRYILGSDGKEEGEI